MRKNLFEVVVLVLVYLSFNHVKLAQYSESDWILIVTNGTDYKCSQVKYENRKSVLIHLWQFMPEGEQQRK